MLFQEEVKRIGLIMKRKAVMLNQPLLLLLSNKAPDIKIVKILCPLFPQIMQKIKVKVARTRSFQ